MTGEEKFNNDKRNILKLIDNLEEKLNDFFGDEDDNEPCECEDCEFTGDCIAGEAMCFSWALHAMKDGYSVARKCWDKGEYIKVQFPDKNSKMNRPYIYGKGQSGSVVPLVVVNSDLFAKDWFAL
jgi:hypothetical protein